MASGTRSFPNRVHPRTSRSLVLSWLLLALATAPSVAQMPEGMDDLRERALALVNESREAEGLAPLSLGGPAVEAAQAHADDMFRRDYYAHESPEGETVQDRYVDAEGNPWELVAENIARCIGCLPPATSATVEELHEGWMNSPGHRANILAPGLASFGFGLTIGTEEGIHAVQTFAGPGVPRGLSPGEEPVVLDPAGQVDRALSHLNRARERAGVSALRSAAALNEAAAAVMPSPGAGDFTLDGGQDLFAALPEDARSDWAALMVLAAACGGCGTEPTHADIRSFVRDWLDDPSYRARLLDPQITHMGLAMQPDGQGRKVAVLMLGRQH